jgi:hypothetical protein
MIAPARSRSIGDALDGADARLRGDARGRDGGIREKLAAGVKGVDRGQCPSRRR